LAALWLHLAGYPAGRFPREAFYLPFLVERPMLVLAVDGPFSFAAPVSRGSTGARHRHFSTRQTLPNPFGSDRSRSPVWLHFWLHLRAQLVRRFPRNGL